MSRSVEIAASPEQVWPLVSDLTRMGDFSPENAGGRWLRGDGPSVGAQFRGTNRNGARRWSTVATVTRCEVARAFTFEVSALGLRVSDWSYTLEGTPGGCRVTETWTDRRGALLRRTAGLVTGTPDRAGFTARSIEQTLERVKERAERT